MERPVHKKLKRDAKLFLLSYYSFFSPIVKEYRQLVSKYGKDDVYRYVKLCGYTQRKGFNYNSNSRVVLIPAEFKLPSDSKVFLEFSTHPGSVRFSNPVLLKKSGDKLVSIPVSEISEAEKSKHKDAILNNLEFIKEEMEFTEKWLFGE